MSHHMGSAEINNVINSDSVQSNSVTKLHDIVHKLEEDVRKSENKLVTEHLNGFVSHDHNKDDEIIDTYALEHVPPLDSNAFSEVDIDADDSWLFATPKSNQTTGTPNNSDSWLKDNVITPELLRIRGSLAEKLEVIAIENRKGRYEKLQRRSVEDNSRKISTLSLDWDFEDVDLSSHGDESLGHLSSIDEFGCDHDFDFGSDIGSSVGKVCQAWTEDSIDYATRPFLLDWSDEDDFIPLKMNLSQSQATYRKLPGSMAIRRTGPVQHNKSVEPPDSDCQLSPRSSGQSYNQVRPRTSGNINKSSSSNSDIPVVRRRGAAMQTAEVATPPRRSLEVIPRRAKDASPRRTKDPISAIRSQEATPIRRSTGSLPQPNKSNDNVARPRRSFSPTVVARPRAQPPR